MANEYVRQDLIRPDVFINSVKQGSQTGRENANLPTFSSPTTVGLEAGWEAAGPSQVSSQFSRSLSLPSKRCSSQQSKRRTPPVQGWSTTQMTRVKWHIHASACRTNGNWTPVMQPAAATSTEASTEASTDGCGEPDKMQSYVCGSIGGQAKSSALMVPLNAQKSQYPRTLRVLCDLRAWRGELQDKRVYLIAYNPDRLRKVARGLGMDTTDFPCGSAVPMECLCADPTELRRYVGEADITIDPTFNARGDPFQALIRLAVIPKNRPLANWGGPGDAVVVRLSSSTESSNEVSCQTEAMNSAFLLEKVCQQDKWWLDLPALLCDKTLLTILKTLQEAVSERNLVDEEVQKAVETARMQAIEELTAQHASEMRDHTRSNEVRRNSAKGNGLHKMVKIQKMQKMTADQEAEKKRLQHEKMAELQKMAEEQEAAKRVFRRRQTDEMQAVTKALEDQRRKDAENQAKLVHLAAEHSKDAQVLARTLEEERRRHEAEEAERKVMEEDDDNALKLQEERRAKAEADRVERTRLDQEIAVEEARLAKEAFEEEGERGSEERRKSIKEEAQRVQQLKARQRALEEEGRLRDEEAADRMREEEELACEREEEVVQKLHQEEEFARSQNLLRASRTRVRVFVECATDLRSADVGGKSDPYCVVKIPGQQSQVFATEIQRQTLSPAWRQEYTFDAVTLQDGFIFETWDHDDGKKDDFLGSAHITSDCFRPDGFEDSLELHEKKGRPMARSNINRHAMLTVKIECLPMLRLEGQPRVFVKLISAQSLHAADKVGKADPYCTVGVAAKPFSRFQSKYINKTLNPKWNEESEILDYERGDALEFLVWDHHRSGSDPLGTVVLTSEQFDPDGFDGTVDLVGLGATAGSSLTVSVAVF